MNQYYQKFKEPHVEGARDPAFWYVIEKYLMDIKPIKILTIGAERNLDVNSRAGDGWADFYWAELVQVKGGKLTIVDIDPKAIPACKTILSDFMGKIDINIECGDGIDYIQKDDWDLILLDGSDNPIDMLNEFNKIDRTKTVVMCDDFNSKGVLLRISHPDFDLLQVNYCHQMAVYPKISK